MRTRNLWRKRNLWSMGAALAVSLAWGTVPSRAADTVRGVTDTEIVIGTITDLSGVTAVQGVNNAGGMRMAVETGLRTHQLARSAETALRRIVIAFT